MANPKERKRLFGTDGIRGKANKYPVTCDIAVRLGRAITYFFQKEGGFGRPKIIIGKDTRRSCYMLEQAIAAGVCSQGGWGIFTGPLPTPGVAFCVSSMRAQAGVMISASHNEYQDNGIKIFDHRGHKLSDKVEDKIEKIIMGSDSIPLPLDDHLGKAERLSEVVGRYVVFAKSSFKSSESLNGIKMALDCANGAGYQVAPMIFSELGADVKAIGVSPNGCNINRSCGTLYPEYCAQEVLAHGAHIGLVLDGDADRLIVIDGKGKPIHGDRIIGILARYLHETDQLGGSLEIVGTVMSNIGLKLYLEEQGLHFHRANVGDRYVAERMKVSGAGLGGEPSGHIILGQTSKTGDGIVSALKVLECIRYYQKPIEELVKDISLHPQVVRSVAINKRLALDSVDSIQSAVKDFKAKLGKRGRILLRYSGTEPKVRVMMEGEDNLLVDRLSQQLSEVVEQSLG